MFNSSLRRIYHQLIPRKVRIPFYTIRKKWTKSLSNSFITISDKNVLLMNKRLRTLSNAYVGERCFIMGNGPSINLMNLELLKNEYVWGSNRCYLLFDRISWRPKFFIAVDKRVVPDNANELINLSYELPKTLFFYPLTFRQNRKLVSNKNVFWYKEVFLNEENLPYSMFSLDPSAYMYSVRTVTVAALQMAVYLGFNPIYLIGCDTSYTVPKTITYEKGNTNLLISTTDDPNHFDSNYFGKGKKWHDPHVDRMIFHYEQSRKVIDELGVKVFNATVGGKLEVFPRVNYLDLFE